MKQSNISRIAISFSILAFTSAAATAGALDGGTAPQATDVAVAGTITATGGRGKAVARGGIAWKF